MKRRIKLIAPFFVGLSIVSLIPLLGLSSGSGQRGVMGHLYSQRSVTTRFPLISIGQVAHAQDQVPNEEIASYAEAVLNIERIRTTTLETISTLMAPDPVPAIACNQADSVNGLPEDVQNLVVAFCEESITIVESTGLTVAQFNQITAIQAENQELFDAIQAALIRLQNSTSDVTDSEGSEDIDATTEES